MSESLSPFLELLKNRIDLKEIPFTERGSRLMVFRENSHLVIRLAERWYKRDHQLASYRDRPPLIDNLCFVDEEGNCLAFDQTTYPHRVDCSTRVGAFSLVYLDEETILMLLPESRCGVTMAANMDRGDCDRRGGTLHMTGEIRRNIAYTTNAPILKNHIHRVGQTALRIELIVDQSTGYEGTGSVILLNITPRLGFNRHIPNPGSAIEAAARRWHEWFSAAPPVIDEYKATYYFAWWVMRAGLISTRFYTTREAMTPSKIYYVGVWQWDACFHALAYRHLDLNLACDQIRIILDHQRMDGMLPDAVHDEGVVTHLTFPMEADVTKPPLTGWAAWKLYETSHDREFLEEIYEPIVRWNQWWYDKNDLDQNNLPEYQHPYSSGLDDSPLWDEGTPVESPDLNTYLYMQQKALAKIAGVINQEKDVNFWEVRAKRILRQMIQNSWDAESGYFLATRNGKVVPVHTPFNLFPLISGDLSKDVADRLVGHLVNPDEFWTRYPVPTVAVNDPKYNPTQMWRGPTWINVNYLLIEGLHRSGYQELSSELRRRTLDLVSKHSDIYEFYHPETGERLPKAAPIFGWSSAIFIDLAIQATHERESA
jgi:putative isomerase